ncbi:MAG: helix-turn-helix domain-containing protein [bacterium]|nr:helix-turn-helix domain-containing protein [bacterium]
MGRAAAKITLSPEEREALDRLIRAPSTSQQLALRARMIVLASEGVKVGETAACLKVWRKTVSQWRARWLGSLGSPATPAERLSDAPRSGAPPRITAQEICAILALACERPEDSDVPLSHWSTSDLAREAMRRGLVDRISPRSVGRFLKGCGPQAPSAALLVDAQGGS